MRNSFTVEIEKKLESYFGKSYSQIFEHSELLQYINKKTKSVNKGSKSRSSFGNLYAIYVLVEDYIAGKFHKNKKYAEYEGAKFSDLLKRQRELPFGEKLQNHSLNHRVNEEYKKYFPSSDFIPIIRIVETQRYWINERLLKVKIGRRIFNIAQPIIEIVDLYVKKKRTSFDTFIEKCEELRIIKGKNNDLIKIFITNLLAPNVDARMFEIASFAILKQKYNKESIYIGRTIESIEKQYLQLFKTGRTNANDGGIDFVMKPLGRFFQVTETLDLKKYFLDIDKVQKFPISFVIKSSLPEEDILKYIKTEAEKQYLVRAVVHKYMSCIEEIINLEKLLSYVEELKEQNNLNSVLDEILLQSKVEFNL